MKLHGQSFPECVSSTQAGDYTKKSLFSSAALSIKWVWADGFGAQVAQPTSSKN
jgi:hypothetical protein